MDNKQTIELTWDSGSAYDMFVSLNVLHKPERFGLRGSWAAGVRSRLPGPEREFLQDAAALIWPFDWVHRLPAPKDGGTVLAVLAAMPAEARIPAIQFSQLNDEPEMLSLLRQVADRGAWHEDDLKQFLAFLVENEGDKQVTLAFHRQIAVAELDMWKDLQASGEMLLSSLTVYYDVFFAEEEQRIADALAAALEEAQAIAAYKPLAALLEDLSQGVVFNKAMNMEQLVLVPSFWATPLMIFAQISPQKELFLFGARPANMSLVPGDVVPDALYQALKALADPTRLKILRYLTEEPSTPADLARRLRLRAPTVIHHLDTLRLARLVQLTLSQEGKRYAIRAEAVDNTIALLNDFLGESDGERVSEEDFVTP